MSNKYGSGRFCSSKCAHIRILTKEQKEKLSRKMSKIMKLAYINGNYTYNLSRVTMSKGEIALKNYIKEKFPNDEFTHGTLKKYNNIYLNPDIWSKKLKIIIEYDGIWHFKDINGQLERKHLIDRTLLEFVLKSDYRLIRVEEGYNWTYEDVINAIYNRTDKIILFGDKYKYLFSS